MNSRYNFNARTSQRRPRMTVICSIHSLQRSRSTPAHDVAPTRQLLSFKLPLLIRPRRFLHIGNDWTNLRLRTRHPSGKCPTSCLARTSPKIIQSTDLVHDPVSDLTSVSNTSIYFSVTFSTKHATFVHYPTLRHARCHRRHR